jgi:hypothetical protein
MGLRAGAAAFRRKVLPTGVAVRELGVCSCLRYSWIESVWIGVRDEADEVTEWCGECTGVMSAVFWTFDCGIASPDTRGDCEYGM